MTTKVTVEERVQAGLAWVIARYGKDRAMAIDLHKLDLVKSRCCVLGQLEGDYWEGLRDNHLTLSQAAQLGFQLFQDFEEYQALNATWCALLRNLDGNEGS